MVARSIPAEHQLVVTRDHISWGRGSNVGRSLHAGDLIDERDEIVMEVMTLPSTDGSFVKRTILVQYKPSIASTISRAIFA